MSRRYVLLPRAEGDLDGISDYSERRWGRRPADQYLRELGQAMQKAAEQPSLGRALDVGMKAYRRVTAKSHVIIYRPSADGITVIRILHASMDVTRHLPPAPRIHR